MAFVRKDEEINRLGAEVVKGQDLEKHELKYRNEANESVIVNLNQQVKHALKHALCLQVSTNAGEVIIARSLCVNSNDNSKTKGGTMGR